MSIASGFTKMKNYLRVVDINYYQGGQAHRQFIWAMELMTQIQLNIDLEQ